MGLRKIFGSNKIDEEWQMQLDVQSNSVPFYPARDSQRIYIESKGRRLKKAFKTQPSSYYYGISMQKRVMPHAEIKNEKNRSRKTARTKTTSRRQQH